MGVRIKCEVEHKLLEKGTATIELEVGQERVLVALPTPTGPQWFHCSVEWGQNEDGSITVVGAQLRIATREEQSGITGGSAAVEPPDDSSQQQMHTVEETGA